MHRGDRGYRDDRGDIVLGWLTKITIALAVVGVIAFDVISLGSSYFQAEERAQTAVRAANAAYKSTSDLQAAYDAAVAEVVQDGDTIDPASFTVDPDKRISLTLTRTAPTLVLEKIPPLRRYAEIERTVSARPAS